MQKKSSYKTFFLLLVTLLVVFLLITVTFLFLSNHEGEVREDKYAFLKSEKSRTLSSVASEISSSQRDTRCTFHTCLDVYHCGYNDKNRLSIYVYPLEQYIDNEGVAVTLPISKEFFELLQAILDSPFYTDEPETACLFVPSIDLLNQNNLRLKEIGQVLASLEW